MSKFIRLKLVGDDDDFVFCNVRNIASFFRSPNDTHTLIYFSDSINTFSVIERPEHILKLIRE